MNDSGKFEGMKRISIEELKWIVEHCSKPGRDLLKREEAEIAYKEKLRELNNEKS